MTVTRLCEGPAVGFSRVRGGGPLPGRLLAARRHQHWRRSFDPARQPPALGDPSLPYAHRPGAAESRRAESRGRMGAGEGPPTHNTDERRDFFMGIRAASGQAGAGSRAEAEIAQGDVP